MLDPDCAMAYWGMAECMDSDERKKGALKLAQEKKGKVSERERRYIEALALLQGSGDDEKAKQKQFVLAMERLILAYPDDVEAKAQLLFAHGWHDDTSRIAVDALLRQVLAKNPQHPGAHHFRIHLWDSQEDGKAALDSCRIYPTLAPNIGHAQHMPGHIYAQLGRWEEAADAMDAAARVERRYFYEQRRLPFHSWNYGHNQDYLIANLGYLGRIREGISLAQELLDVPRDPKYSSGDAEWGIASMGRASLLRMRIRGERWDEILGDREAGWPDTPMGRTWKQYSLGMAAPGKGRLDEARRRLVALDAVIEEQSEKKADDKQDKPTRVDPVMLCAQRELRGRVAVASGDLKGGLADLKRAEEIQRTQITTNDPNPYPRPLYESLAWGYLQGRQWKDAEATLREGIKREGNNGFALALLIEALVGAGRREEANTAYDPLRAAWQHADPDLPALKRVQKLLGGGASPAWQSTPPPHSVEREQLGPARWAPFPAPSFVLTDAQGKAVRLTNFRDQNLLLVFYLGGACSSCMKQLEELGTEKTAFAALNTQILAVSSDPPERNRAFLAAAPGHPLVLLSDRDHQAAKQYGAYDEFEGLELHGAVLIDRQGRVWWFRCGSEPFTDVPFLKAEIARMNTFVNAAGPAAGVRGRLGPRGTVFVQAGRPSGRIP